MCFYYECRKCLSLIEGSFENPQLDPIVMVKDSKPNTWAFECEKCYVDTNKTVSE